MEIKTLKQWTREKELGYLKDILNYFHGNISKTAKALGVDRKTIYNKLSINEPVKA